MALELDPNYVFRDFVTHGLPSSGKWDPRKPEIRRLLTEWWQILIALVGDATDLELPNLLINMSITGGDENNIVAEANLPVPSGPGMALLSIVIEEENTGPVTINGKPLLTNGGEQIEPGEILPNDLLLFMDAGEHYRLLTDTGSLRNKLAAEAAADRAEGARDLSEDARDTAEVYRSDAFDYRNDAQVAKSQAELAALAAGAPLFASVGDGLASSADGDVFIVQTEAATEVYRVDGPAAEFLGRLGETSFRSPTVSQRIRTAQQRGEDWLSILDVIPKAEHDGIVERTSTTDLSDYFNEATEYLATKGGGDILIPRGTYIAEGIEIRDGVSYSGQGQMASIIKLPDAPTSSMFKALRTAETHAGWWKGLQLDGGGTTVFNGLDFSTLLRLDVAQIADCFIRRFNVGYHGSAASGGNDRYPTIETTRIHNNQVGMYISEHTIVGQVDVRANDVGITGRMNDCHFQGTKIAYNRIGAEPLGGGGGSGGAITFSRFSSCGIFGNAEVGLRIGSSVIVNGCQIVGSGNNDIGIDAYAGERVQITNNRFGQLTAATQFGDACIVLGSLTSFTANHIITNNIFNCNQQADTAGAIRSPVRLSRSVVLGNSFHMRSSQKAISVGTMEQTSILGNFANIAGVGGRFYDSSATFQSSFGGNVIRASGTDYDGPMMAIGSSSSNIGNAITGNSFIKESTGTAPVLSGSLNRSAFSGNVLNNNARMDMALVQTDSETEISGNRGFRTKTRGRFVFSSGNTTHTITHSIDVPIVIDDVFLTPLTNNAGQAIAGGVYISSVDNANKTFTVTASSPMGTNAVFGYSIEKF